MQTRKHGHCDDFIKYTDASMVINIVYGQLILKKYVFVSFNQK